MNARPQHLPNDPDAREALATQAIRRGDMETLQQLADSDTALGRRMVRKLINGGCRWVISRHVDGTPAPRIDERYYAKIHPYGGVSGIKYPECLAYTLHYVVVIAHGDSIILRVTWDDRKRRLFACDCAERALPFYSGDRPEVLAESVRKGRHLARGEIFTEPDRRLLYELRNKARLAARGALDTASTESAWSCASCVSHGAGAASQGGAVYAVSTQMSRYELHEDRAAALTAEHLWQRWHLLAYLLDEIPLNHPQETP